MKTNKHFFAAFAVFLVVLTILPSAVLAAGFPKHQNYIADDADILTEQTINDIKDTNKNLAGDVQLTIAVCTVKTTNGEDIATYARNLFSEWKLGEGILILIAKDDNNYYFVPSVGVEDILTNEEIASIRDEYFEGDFSNGTYDRAVKKVVTKLKTTLVAGVQARASAADAAAGEETGETEEKGTPAGNAIVTFFKVILWIVIIAAILFVGIFVWAMFNDDVAAILQKFIFRRKNTGRSGSTQNFYDERLYGNRNPNMQRPQMQGQRRPNPNPNGYPARNGYGNNGYPVQQQNSGYLGDGRTYPGQGYAPNGYPAQQGYPQQNYGNRGGYPAQGQYGQYQNNPNMQQRPQTMNPNYGYGYPQQGQNPQMQQNGGAYYQQGQQGYPQQGQNPNYNNRQGYGGQQNMNDATVQFNIPRRN